jgi:putative chitinase
VSALNDAGITSPKAHANVLATVKAESNFKVKSENLNYTSADRIKSIFGARRIPSVEFAQQFVKNPEALANHVYKTTDGNSAPGDGFKYRGRGFIQHTGKNQYAAISKATGTDLLSNPDALNSPEVAAKAIPWFFLGYKRMKPEDLDNMSKVNKAVGFAGGAEYAAKREASAQQIYAQMQSGSGTQMASASSDVASGQRQQMKPQTPVVVNAPTTNTKVVKTTQVASSKRSDVGSSLANAAA